MFNVNAWNYAGHGGAGFGMADVNAARGAGASDLQIRQLAQRASINGLNIGGGAQNVVNSIAKPAWDYGGHGAPGFGMTDVQAAIAQGKSYDEIKQYSTYAGSNGLSLGQAGQDWLNKNAGNPMYMSWDKRQAYEKGQWEQQMAAQMEAQKKNNPAIRANNAALQAGSAGGVRINRSEEWGKSGNDRSTGNLSRAMLIGGLNI